MCADVNGFSMPPTGQDAIPHLAVLGFAYDGHGANQTANADRAGIIQFRYRINPTHRSLYVHYQLASPALQSPG
ncbi:MAG: hypothetical protein ABIR13_01145, partial [Polaromonas sp.]